MSTSRRGVMLVEMAGQDIRELSFQNVLDTILKPAGVKVGGFPEDIFLDLEEDEQEKWTCSICYLIIKDAKQCDNKHLFCHTCIFAWSMTYGENSQTCPVCRCEQRDRYTSNKEMDRRIGEKRVKCPEKGCTFRSPMKIFLMHSHGRALFSNDGINLESLRPSRPPGSRLLVLPPGSQDSPAERVRGLRDQLHQGRAMLHQMMMLLHLEMQLRQQALVSYAHATDPDTRLARLDEVLALNEQLNEVGGILSALLSNPMSRQSLRASEASSLTSSRSLRESDSEGRSESTRIGGGLNAGNVHIVQTRNVSDSTNANDETNEGESSDSESSASTQYGLINRYSRAAAGEQRSVTMTSGSTVQRRSSAARNTPGLDRPRRHTENVQQSSSSGQESNTSQAGAGMLLDRRNSSQRQIGTNSQNSISVTSGQNVNNESITSLANQPARSQSATRTTSLPPISGGTSARTTSGLPVGSNTHQNVMQTLASSNNNSSSVPNRNTNASASSGSVTRLISEQSPNTITIDTTQVLSSTQSQQPQPQSAKQNPSTVTPQSSESTVPNSVVRQSLTNESVTTESSVGQASYQPVRATYAPQRRFSRQNSSVTSPGTSLNSEGNSSNIPTRRSDGGSRMTGVASRRPSISRSVQNATDGHVTRSNSRPQLSSRTPHSNRPILNRRNSREVSNSTAQPPDIISGSTHSSTRTRSRSEASARTEVNRNNALPNRSERLDRARRRSEIAQEHMNETNDNNL